MLALVCASVGCELTPPHAPVSLRDPTEVARQATEIRFQRDGKEPISQQIATEFPILINLRGEVEEDIEIRFEALAADGSVVASAVRRVALASSTPETLVVDLLRPCSTESECDDGIFCNGAEQCLDGLCRRQDAPCQPSPYACVQLECVEAFQACSIGVDHTLCEADDDVSRFCDPTAGCQEGLPCQEDSDCQDASVCNGEERCVGKRCTFGVPPAPSSDPCSTQACIDPLGIVPVAPDPALAGRTCAEGRVCAEGLCSESFCGDGIVDEASGEDCDDQNDNPNDGCASCRTTRWVSTEILGFSGETFEGRGGSQLTVMATAVDGTIYLADSAPASFNGSDSRLWRYDPSSRAVSRLAGGALGGSPSDTNVPASETRLGQIFDLAVDSLGNLYLAGERIRRVDRRTGLLSEVHWGSVERVAVSGTETVFAVDNRRLYRIDEESLPVSGGTLVRTVLYNLTGVGNYLCFAPTDCDEPFRNIGSIGWSFTDLAFGADGSLYVLHNGLPSRLVRMNPETLGAETVVEIPGEPRRIEANPTGTFMVTTSNGLYEVDPEEGSIREITGACTSALPGTPYDDFCFDRVITGTSDSNGELTLLATTQARPGEDIVALLAGAPGGVMDRVAGGRDVFEQIDGQALDSLWLYDRFNGSVLTIAGSARSLFLHVLDLDSESTAVFEVDAETWELALRARASATATGFTVDRSGTWAALVDGTQVSRIDLRNGSSALVFDSAVLGDVLVDVDGAVFFRVSGGNAYRVAPDGAMSALPAPMGTLRGIDAEGRIYHGEDVIVRSGVGGDGSTPIVGTTEPGASTEDGPATSVSVSVESLSFAGGDIWLLEPARLRRVRNGLLETVEVLGEAEDLVSGTDPGQAGWRQMAATETAIYLERQAFRDSQLRPGPIQSIEPSTGNIDRIGGWAVGDVRDGAFASSRLFQPHGATLLDPQTALIADGDNGYVRIVDFGTSQVDSVVGRRVGDPRAVADWRRFGLMNPRGIVAMTGGASIFISDAAQHSVYQIDTTRWEPARFAGSEVPDFADGPALAARFDTPMGLAVDEANNRLLVADFGNHLIRAVDLVSGDTATLAGRPETAGFLGDGGPATDAVLNGPTHIAVTSAGFYVSDSRNHRVRFVNLMGTIQTVLGTGAAASSRGGKPARDLPTNDPRGLAVDPYGNLFLATRNMVFVIEAGVDGVALGDDAVYVVDGRSGEGSIGRCDTALALLDDSTLLIGDRCAGTLRRLERAP
ncbi:MAG: DUF4215 domain-containing protein [Myxococcota bacterium]